MAVADTKKHLKEMIKALNDTYARGQIDEYRQIVTLEFNNIVKAWMQGYSNFLTKHAGKNFPASDAINWKDGVSLAWASIKTSIESAGGEISKYTSTEIIFYESKNTKNMYDGIKKHGTDFIQTQLGDYKLTDAKAEMANNPGMTGQAAAMGSDIAEIKKGTHRLHKGSTTVGSARLAMSMKWMSKTRFFKDFLSSKQAKEIQDKYGDLLIVWNTTGTKKRGLKVTPKEDIGISINAGKENKKGEEPADFSAIYTKLRKALLEWAKKAELDGRKGSPSIRKNTENIVEHVVVGHLVTVKGAKAKKATKTSARVAQTVSIKKKGRSNRTSKKGPAPTIVKRRVKRDRTSIVHLIGILNDRIKETVAKNMGKEGRLVYRSGRFANSVKITDIVRTQQGFPSVGYTYQRRPYDTFEPGGAQGSSERDPRKLIDASIREIAMNLAIGRFYTRRV